MAHWYTLLCFAIFLFFFLKMVAEERREQRLTSNENQHDNINLRSQKRWKPGHVALSALLMGLGLYSIDLTCSAALTTDSSLAGYMCGFTAVIIVALAVFGFVNGVLYDDRTLDYRRMFGARKED